MKKAVLAVLLAVGAAGCEAQPSLRFADGSVQTADAWLGRWLVINYWAEWCAPCWAEIEELNALNEDEALSAAVIGVNFDGIEGEDLRRLITKMDIRFPVALDDPRPIWGYDRSQVLPMTVIIGPGGNLRGQLPGPQTLESLLAAMR
ncbi:MAG: TlpA disulfide reductase family protein [Gammaproteobacteria bacterium]|nr:TlpA disulfide reductase family protein [Gammaproteobacteria bacterium]